MTTELKTKGAWRAEMKRRLANFLGPRNSVSSHSAIQNEITTSISEILKSRPGIWLAFAAGDDEPTAVVPVSGVQFAFPKIDEAPAGESPASGMHFFVPVNKKQDSSSLAWKANRFGLREPNSSSPDWRPLNVREARGALVPGLGFDRRLRRLGRGGGYYDRFLKTSSPEFLKIGVGYSAQLVDELPCEAHDIGLDGVVTDRETIWRLK